MMRSSIGKILIFTCLLAACAKETPGTGSYREYVLGASLSGMETRTSLSGKEVHWSEGDVVSAVSYSSVLDCYDVTRGLPVTDIEGRKARIKVRIPADYSPSYLLYPGDGTLGWDSASGNFVADIPGSYKAVPGGFPKGSNVSFGAISGNGAVSMKNALALLKFKIESEDIASVTFSGNDGEDLCGKVSFDSGTMEVKSVSGGTKVKLIPDGECFAPGIYCLPAVPRTFGKGISLTVEKSTGETGRKSSSAALTIERNQVLDLGSESEWGIEYKDLNRTVTVVFSNGIKYSWPFKPAIPKEADIIAAAGAPMGPFTMASEPDCKFYIRVQAYLSSDSCRLTNGAGFRFGSTPHDYLLLPAIDGYALTSVKITCGNNSAKVSITDNPASGDPTELKGGEYFEIPSNADHEFLLSGTEPGVAYRIDNPNTKKCAGILNLVLTYKASE